MEEGSTSQIPSPENGRKDEFPKGLRVLAVDDDPVCLKMLETLLRQCLYEVTVTQEAVTALKLLRENKEKFNIVITDVRMPDMDGFKLLEVVGLELDLPVIMMSANREVDTVMKGIKHGACDYLLKPIRIEELQNIWQHVIRKTLVDYKEAIDTADRPDHVTGATDHDPKLTRKSRDQNADHSDEDPSGKKQRLQWSPELHSRFIVAYNQLGTEKAVPKRILDLMKTPGLTRENVASHLQKFRKGLNRNSARIGLSCNDSAASNRTCGNPRTTVLSFDKQHPDVVNCLDGFRTNGCSNLSRTIPLDHVQNSSSYGISSGNPPLLSQPLTPGGNLLQDYMEVPEVGTFQQRISRPGEVPSNPLILGYLHRQLELTHINQSLTPTRNQFDAFMGVGSQLPNCNINGEQNASSPQQLGLAPNQHSVGISVDVDVSTYPKVINGGAINLNPVTPNNLLPEAVGNILPGQFEVKNISHYQGNTELDLERKMNGGVSLDMQICNREYMRHCQMKFMEPLENMETESFLLSRSNSTDDLNAAVKQFQQVFDSKSSEA